MLSDEFSHMRPEERQQLLHVSGCIKYSEYSVILSLLYVIGQLVGGHWAESDVCIRGDHL